VFFGNNSYLPIKDPIGSFDPNALVRWLKDDNGNTIGVGVLYDIVRDENGNFLSYKERVFSYLENRKFISSIYR